MMMPGDSTGAWYEIFNLAVYERGRVAEDACSLAWS